MTESLGATARDETPMADDRITVRTAQGHSTRSGAAISGEADKVSASLRVSTWDADTVLVEPWVPGAAGGGHDPRSAYVELFWLPTLGPSTTLLLRYLARALEGSPSGFVMDTQEAARSLGIGHRDGPRSPIRRSLERAQAFGMCRPIRPGVLAARTRLPDLSPRQVSRLPRSLATRHEALLYAAFPGPQEALGGGSKEDTSSTRVRTPKPVAPLRT